MAVLNFAFLWTESERDRAKSLTRMQHTKLHAHRGVVCRAPHKFSFDRITEVCVFKHWQAMCKPHFEWAWVNRNQRGALRWDMTASAKHHVHVCKCHDHVTQMPCICASCTCALWRIGLLVWTLVRTLWLVWFPACDRKSVNTKWTYHTPWLSSYQ